MNNDYWEKYYRELLIPEPSDFARFCLDYIEGDEGVLDVGCGNGRDTFFLAKTAKEVIGIDQAAIVIDINNVINPYRNAGFMIYDIGNIAVLPPQECIYLRFVLHAISDEEQESLFGCFESQLGQTAKKIFIETRSIEDTKTTIGGHNRRFTEKKKLIESMEERLGFETIVCKEDRGFAKTENEDPLLIRYIGKR